MGRVKYLWTEEYVGKRVIPEIPEEGDRIQPYSDKIWSEVEKLSLQRIKEIQWEKLQVLLKFTYENSPFYQEKWKEVGITPEDIKSLEDLPKLPIITKADCARDRKENPPFGTIATSPPVAHIRYLQTSGTTGEPQLWTIPRQEWEDYFEFTARAMYANGIRSNWRGFFAFGFPPVPGMWGIWDTSEHIFGNQNVPKGTLPTTIWLRIIKNLAGEAPSFLGSTPTYALRQIEVAKEMGIDPKELGIKIMVVAGEPGYGIPSTNKLISQEWGVKLHDQAGSTENSGPFMFSCDHLASQEEPSDHISADAWLFELLDPKTLEPVENQPSGIRSGVACVTTLNKIGMPAIRFLLNDYMTILEGVECPCGRTLPIAKGGIKARADDMIHIKGVNIYPGIIEEAVRSFPELSPEYQIKKTLTGATVLVEPLEKISESEKKRIAKALQELIRDKTLVRLDIKMKELGSLPREELKAKRIVE